MPTSARTHCTVFTEAFGKFGADGRVPEKGKIYICGSKAYVWDAAGKELKPIAGSEDQSSTSYKVMSNAEVDALWK